MKNLLNFLLIIAGLMFFVPVVIFWSGGMPPELSLCMALGILVFALVFIYASEKNIDIV
jgi:cytochrome c oxidase assembly factor CtaG